MSGKGKGGKGGKGLGKGKGGAKRHKKVCFEFNSVIYLIFRS
jgi:hypothetical protein